MHQLNSINWYGTYTLLVKEIKRFIKVYHQTIIAPVVSALIFLSIFGLAIGSNGKMIHNVPYIDFAGYGLIIMSMIQNSFSNSSSSLIMSKVIGFVNDILMPPLDGEEIVIAYTIGGIARGVAVGIFLSFILYFIIDFRIYSLTHLLLISLLANSLMACLGILSSIITDNFDQNAAITSYVITPLSFLSGTFYSIHDLPWWIKLINLANPFFYIIDGFRYSFIGASDGNTNLGLTYLFILNIVFLYTTVRILNSGWKLKP